MRFSDEDDSFGSGFRTVQHLVFLLLFPNSILKIYVFFKKQLTFSENILYNIFRICPMLGKLSVLQAAAVRADGC